MQEISCSNTALKGQQRGARPADNSLQNSSFNAQRSRGALGVAAASHVFSPSKCNMMNKGMGELIIRHKVPVFDQWNNFLPLH